MVPLASEHAERGEWLPRPPLGEGERDRDSYCRATCNGVEGTEFECCDTMEGLCARGCVFASSLLPVLGTALAVIVAALLGTLCPLSPLPLLPSGSVRAGA